MSIYSLIQTQPLAPTDPEAQVARQSRQALASLMQTNHGEIRFRTGTDNDASPEVVLSSSAAQLLLGALEEIGKGNGVTLIPTDAELTTQKAAEMARVSRPFFVKLLEEGKIPFRMVGAHRRVLYRDVARYIEAEEARRITVMKELVAETERLELYECPPSLTPISSPLSSVNTNVHGVILSHQEPISRLSSELKELASQLREVHQQAETLGLFVEDRPLLHCAGCGLREDVRFDGRLMTYIQGVADADDSGLRFEPCAGGFVCPLCHATLSVPDEEEDD